MLSVKNHFLKIEFCERKQKYSWLKTTELRQENMNMQKISVNFFKAYLHCNPLAKAVKIKDSV